MKVGINYLHIWAARVRKKSRAQVVRKGFALTVLRTRLTVLRTRVIGTSPDVVRRVRLRHSRGPISQNECALA